MLHSVAPVPVAKRRRRARRFAFVSVGVSLAAVLATILTLLVNGAFSTAVAPLAPQGAPVLPVAPPVAAGPFEPTADHGLIRGDQFVTLADEDVPAIARLNPELRDAMRQAEKDAAADDLTLQVTSGWRSEEYQRWLFDDAIEFYGSAEVARQYVATPERSSHVTGDAVDIGPVDAQFWLIQYGSEYGICQTYANERWHFELATEPGGVCPEMKADASS